MELLEYKKRIFELCNISEITEIRDILLNVVINHDVSFFDRYQLIANDQKDWLQALYQYYEADRIEKKQDYTPQSLCKLVSELSGNCNFIYDCCGGSGALTVQMINDKKIKNVHVEELDQRVIPFLLFNLCLNNACGVVVCGDALSREFIKCYHLRSGERYSYCVESDQIPRDFMSDVAISNPPYNIKWNPPMPLEMDERFPVMPPASNANYAFVLNCLSHAKEKVVMILPNGVMSEKLDYEIRKYLIDNDLIETVAIMPDKMFEVTTISTCIMVLNKNKKHKGEICFIDSRKNCTVEEREQNGQFGGASHTNRTYKKAYNVLSDENIARISKSISDRTEESEFSAIKTNKEIAENDYLLTPSRYISFSAKEEKHRAFQEIAENINYISRMQNSCKLVINETIAKKLGLNADIFKQSKKNSEEIMAQMLPLGIKIETEDYIQFTKNKNEFIFKCNDKEILPDILLHFFSVWKNQIAILNTMQNTYLAELRDTLLPDLMNGKIEL